MQIGAHILKFAPLCIKRDCAMGPVAAILVFARAGKTDWTTASCLRWNLYDFVKVRIIPREWFATSSKQGNRRDTPFEAVHAKLTLQCIKKFCDDGMSREFAKAV